MAILAGIDEAGLGPILGPLVVTGAAFRVPDDRLQACLWRTLRESCAAKPSRAEHRLVVADSKLLYRTRGPRSGLGALERTALVAVAASGKRPTTWREWLDAVSPGAVGELDAYAWYEGRDFSLPLDRDSGDVGTLANALGRDLTRHGAAIHGIYCVPLLEGAFNHLVTATNNKSSVSLGLVLKIMDRLIRSAPRERLSICCDRLGGRVRYRDALMTAFPGQQVTVLEESEDRSAYRFADGCVTRDIEFVTRGEQRHFTVALASIVSKYTRELYMHAFNGYWAGQVSGLRPTAGYYADARRWLDDMSGELERRRVDRRRLVRLR